MKHRIVTAMLTLSAARLFAANGAAPARPSYLQGVGIQQHLNAQTPLTATFLDETGRAVTLGSYLGKRPAVLALVYYTCPLLCDQILRGVAHGLRPTSLHPGKDFDVIAISINPAEGPADAAAKKREIVQVYKREGDPSGWHFLTGDEANIRAVADAVGFHYRYDPKSKMFIHGAGVMVLTPEGRAARYFYGVTYTPSDLQLGLVEASHHEIGSLADEILLFCCSYDPTTGKYTATLLGLLRIGGAAFVALLAGFLGFWWRREMRRPGERAAHP